MEDIRTLLSLTAPEKVQPFPMYHIIKKGQDSTECIVEMAHTKNPEMGVVYGMPEGTYLEALEVLEKRQHKGKFQPGVKALFFAVRCKKINRENIKSVEAGKIIILPN